MRIGIDLGGTKIEIIALDDHGGERLRRRVATPAGDYAATLRAVADLVTAAEAELGETGTVGAATPGAVSPASGLLKNSNSVCLNGRRLKADLEALLGREILLENDANCFALSEARDGAAAGADVVFGVILGTGVGGGLVVHGRVLRGANAIAGEWGHNPLPWPGPDELPGPACYCGRRGCVETFLSGPGLSADFARAGEYDCGGVRSPGSGGEGAQVAHTEAGGAGPDPAVSRPVPKAGQDPERIGQNTGVVQQKPASAGHGSAAAQDSMVAAGESTGGQGFGPAGGESADADLGRSAASRGFSAVSQGSDLGLESGADGHAAGTPLTGSTPSRESGDPSQKAGIPRWEAAGISRPPVAAPRQCSAEEIAERAARGDPAAEAALARYEDRLARGLAAVINVLDPDVIVLGGGLSKLARLYTRIPRLWALYVFSDRVDTKLVPPRHGDSSGVRGAAWLWGPDRR